jgi:hypothetical protein
LNHKEPNIVEYLAFFSVKYSVYLSELYQALVNAKNTGESTCEDLTIQCRGNIKDQTIFLIKKAELIIIQFKVPEEFLIRKNISFETWLDTDKIRKQVAKKTSAHTSTLIQDLRHGMKKVNVMAEVLETQKPHAISTQYGNRVMLTDAHIADETGKIKFCLWGPQTNVPAPGDVVQIKHASVRTFNGEKYLSLGRIGTYSILKSNAAKVEQQPETTAKNTIYA